MNSLEFWIKENINKYFLFTGNQFFWKYREKSDFESGHAHRAFLSMAFAADKITPLRAGSAQRASSGNLHRIIAIRVNNVRYKKSETQMAKILTGKNYKLGSDGLLFETGKEGGQTGVNCKKNLIKFNAVTSEMFNKIDNLQKTKVKILDTQKIRDNSIFNEIFCVDILLNKVSYG